MQARQGSSSGWVVSQGWQEPRPTIFEPRRLDSGEPGVQGSQ